MPTDWDFNVGDRVECVYSVDVMKVWAGDLGTVVSAAYPVFTVRWDTGRQTRMIAGTGSEMRLAGERVALDWPDDCRCPPIQVGLEACWGSRAWNEDCPLHGVGTSWWKTNHSHAAPYGYAEVKDWSREEWLAWKRQAAAEAAAEEARWETDED